MDLRANTAVDVLIGPFVDSTDGDTAETALTIAQADVRLSKNGQNMAQKNDNTSAAHDELGYYNCELNATDTNTEGNLVLVVKETGALPVRHEYNVMAEAAWDSLYVAKDTGFMDVNIKAVSEDTTAADNLESACDNYSATRGLSGTALPAVAAGGAGGIPTDSTGKTAFNDPTSGVIASACADTVWDESRSGHVAVGSFGESILDPGSAEAWFDPATDAVATVTTVTNNPTVAQIVDGVWDEDTSGHVTAGTFGEEVQGRTLIYSAISSVTSTTQFQLVSGSTLDDIYNGMQVIIYDDTDFVSKYTGTIVDYTGSTKEIQVSPTPDFTVDFDDYVRIVAAMDVPTASEIVDEWETQSQVDPTGFHVNVKEVDGTTQTANDNGAGINTLITQIGTAGAGLTDLGGMSTAMKAEVTAATITLQMTESYAADGTAPTLAQALFAIQQFLQERSVSGTTVTVSEVDGVTGAMTFTLDSSTSPTSITRAT